MNDINIDMIQGKAIEIVNFNLNVIGFKSVLTLEFLLNNKTVRMVFDNVSCLSIKDFSTPYQVGGFEILDNKDRGWEESHRYSINDYEDGTIKFYCESFEVI